MAKKKIVLIGGGGNCNLFKLIMFSNLELKKAKSIK